MTMFDWIMRRLGASVEELANEAYEELLGYDPTSEYIDSGLDRETFDKQNTKGHKPPRHDVQKLKQLYDLHETAVGNRGQGPEGLDHARQKWSDLTEMSGDEREVKLVYAEVKDQLRDPSSTGFLGDDEDRDPFDVTMDVLTAKHKHWSDIIDLALRTNASGALGPLSAPLFSEEEAHKLLTSVIKKQQVIAAPKMYRAITNGLMRLRDTEPESYKLWPWYVKQVKKMYSEEPEGLAGSAYTHWVDVVGSAGKQIAELRRENRLPQNFDINKLDFGGLEDWFMQWKRENRASEDQGAVVYQWDDGWTMQRLDLEEQLQFEGDEMGHCVGDYAHHVYEGKSIIYSLRDPKGHPHVTIEMEGPELLTKLQDEPAKDLTPDDMPDYQMRTGNGDVRLTPLFEDESDRQAFNQYGGLGRDNRWPSYLTQLDRYDPHSVQENKQYYNQQGIPWDKSFYVVQVQGNSNLKPKPEYQKRVKEFLDYLKTKGFSFQRSDEWYPNDDERDDEKSLGGHDTYSEWAGRHNNRYWGSDGDNVMGWYDHYQENPDLYTGGEDQYGITQGQKFTGYAAEEAIDHALEAVLEQGEDPDHAARAILHYTMLEHFSYADIDQAVRGAANKMQDKANDEHERAWMADNGTWMYTNPESGQDEEVENYDDIPEDAYFQVDEDPKYADGYKFINALDQYLAWYYNNKKEADRDRHPSMTLPRLKWIGDNIPDGFAEGTDPYAPSPEEQAKADAQAQQDAAGPGFSTLDLNGVFSSVKTSEQEHDPDYAFVYYMSELQVEPWEVNTRYEKIFEELLNEFNVDLGNSALDIDPADVAAGEVYIRKGRPVIEHKQLCPPEIREQAEEAIGQWWGKQWLEGIKEHDWYEVDTDHTLTGDA